MSAGLQTEQSRGNPAAQRYGAYPATRGTAARPPDTLHPIFAKKGIKSMKKQNRNTAKRLLSLFMALAMCMSLFCTTAFASPTEEALAEEEQSTSGPVQEQENTPPNTPPTTEPKEDAEPEIKEEPTEPEVEGGESTGVGNGPTIPADPEIPEDEEELDPSTGSGEGPELDPPTGTGEGTNPPEGSNEPEEPGESEPEEKDEMVTLTYDANAGEDEVVGMPTPQTVPKGDSVTIRNYRSLTREGYKIYGWSTNPDAVFPDNDLRIGTRYTLNEDTTFYAVWEKNAPDPGESQDGPMVDVTIQPTFLDSASKKMPHTPMVAYDYSYTYEGKLYAGRTTAETIGGFLVTGKHKLPIPQAAKEAGASISVTLTPRGDQIDGYTRYHLITSGGGSSNGNSVTLTVTPSGIFYTVWHYYYVPAPPVEPQETEREVSIEVSFQDDPMHPFTLDVVNGHYRLTYSYENAQGEIVTETLDS